MPTLPTTPRRPAGAARLAGPALAGVLALAPAAPAQDWSNAGGNAGRNGSTSALGPSDPTPLWSGSRPSLIAWQPVIEGARVFAVRQGSFPPETQGSPVVAMDLATGVELWAAHVPAFSGDWTAWVAGARDGRVYAARSGNGATVSARLYALRADTGAIAWQSADRIDAGAYDGVVFADNGDLIIASFRSIRRIRATDGTTAWTAARTGSVSGDCGGALGQGHGTPAVYVADAVPGGHSIKKFDLATGSFLYQSPVMPGFTIQDTPLVGPDGTVYLCRVQNNPATDFFYAFEDTGSALAERWHRPARYSYAAEFAATRDAVFMVAPDNSIRKLNAADGAELAASDPQPAPLSAVRMAVDARGRLFVSNGEFAGGRFACFNPDLSELWAIAVPNINIGAPALAADGTLIIAGTGRSFTAYAGGACSADFNGDGFVDFFDYADYVGCFETGQCPEGTTADFNGDGFADFFDYADFVAAFEAGC